MERKKKSVKNGKVSKKYQIITKCEYTYIRRKKMNSLHLGLSYSNCRKSKEKSCKGREMDSLTLETMESRKGRGLGAVAKVHT
jgi:hypothetical protein